MNPPKTWDIFAHVQIPGLFSERRGLEMRLISIQAYIHTYIHTYIHDRYIHHNVVDKMSCLFGYMTIIQMSHKVYDEHVQSYL